MKNQFYAKQSVITDPRKFKEKYGVLPDTPEELLELVQGLVVHGDQGKLYGVTFSKRQNEEELLRTVPQMLERLLQTDHSPLNVKRPANLRLIGMCRDYSLLLVSFLREKGIPARIRAGYANYFQSEMPYEDHWVVEYYKETEERWVRVDAQLDEVQRKHFKVTFDTLDMPENAGYLLGGEAWSQCRSGEKHQEDFGYNKNWKGWHSIKGNLLHDFNSLIGYELLPWDLWTDLSTKKYSELHKEEKEILDEMAILTSNRNVTETELHSLLNRLPKEYMEAIQSNLKRFDVLEKAETVNPDTLESKFQISPVKEQVKRITYVKPEYDRLILRGARQNNLKNVSVEIPKEKLTVITGVSGSGKSSLAFDTIYAEGRRRYLDNMSSLAKMQEQTEKPDFDVLQGLTPTIAIEQKKGSQNPRSTVGTLTGILDHLRMLYVSIGIPHCAYCGTTLVKESKNKNRCTSCGNLFQKLNASVFNANTHAGACQECNGLGYLYEVDVNKIITDERLSLLDGASPYWGKLRGKKKTGNWMVGELYAIADDMKVDLEKPWCELPESFQHAVLYGTGEKIYTFKFDAKERKAEIRRPASGAIAHINRLFREAKAEDNQQKQYMKEIPCPTCNGELLGMEARYTTIRGYRLPELTRMSIAELWNWACSLQTELSPEQMEKAKDVLTEMRQKISNLLQVGLPYLTLNRTAPTLSGGELQRVRLSSQLGSDLVGITYILDEPSIGLHPRDHHLMIDTMCRLRDKGNTVIVVEHDRDTMLRADYIVDVGPGAGAQGGKIIAAGTVKELQQNPVSVTGRYLAEPIAEKPSERLRPTEWMWLRGCTENNLKNIDVQFPLHCMCCISGISGSGKSTLIFSTLIPALQKALTRQHVRNENYKALEGYEDIDGFVHMDQTPIGKTSRSIPATYIGVFDAIRTLYAQQDEAKSRGYGESGFSFNSKEGQCPVCEGQGQIKVAFQYMADHYVTCPECKGNRYQESVLEVLYKGKSIADVLKMDIAEAITFFAGIPEIVDKLTLLDEVGLSYLRLGQSTVTLSGGEAQRLKLAKELGGKKKKHMIYILDEPTTGLHFKDIERLLLIFRKLVAAGHTLYIIEHNTDVIRAADWIIDMGPDGGQAGGLVMAEGSPEEIRENKESVTGSYI